jgi:FkbM family methyltransferase
MPRSRVKLARLLDHLRGGRVARSSGERRDVFELQRHLLGTSPVRRVVDAGCNRGDTLSSYRSSFPEAELTGFEPTPELSEGLRRRFEGDSSTSIEQLALGSKQGTQELYLYDDSAVNSLHELTDSTFTEGELTCLGKIWVDVVTLDEYCRKHGVQELDIVKMDLQGGELAALEGMSELLETGRVRLLMLELLFVPVYEAQCYAWEVCELLEGAGYRLFDLYGARHASSGQLKWADGIFIPRQ